MIGNQHCVIILHIALLTTSLLQVTSSNSCIRRNQNAERNFNDDLEESGLLQLMVRNNAKTWRGERVVYRIENMPECSDGLTEVEVKRIVDSAAEQWNSVTNANVMLVNADSQSNTAVNIRISFKPCQHQDPNIRFDRDFEPCSGVYAHSIHFGDMHLNTHMTWTDTSTLTDQQVANHEYILINLYSIVLHEFGHTLGLYHSMNPTQVMFGEFGGIRKYRVLSLGQEDRAELLELYPIEQRCKDLSIFCKKRGADAVCQEASRREVCPDTCGDCTCVDDYIKCSPSMCGELGDSCKKTCGLCGTVCTGLQGEDMGGVTTDTEFPIAQGSTVTVSCPAGYTLSGSNSGTCVEGTVFNFSQQPSCQIIEEEEEGPEELTCEDSVRNCRKILRKGKRECSNKWMRKRCTRTCGYC